MAEILVKAQNTGQGAFGWLRGHCVVVMEDGHEWGAEETLPKFAVFKFPGVPVEKVQKYLDTDADPNLGILEPTMRRKWQIRWADLPLAARNKITANGGLTILVAAFGYQGAYDYTWAQVKQFFHNNVTNTDEAADIS